MHRNLERRIEIIFPVTAANLRRRLIDAIKVYFADNVKARQLMPDGGGGGGGGGGQLPEGAA